MSETFGLDELVGDFASGVVAADRLFPVAVNMRTKVPYQPGIGPHTEDPDGGFDFGNPDEEYFSFINELEAPGGYVSVRPPDVSDDGLLGDRTCCRPARLDRGFHQPLASR
jgi:hypothetical protein